MSITSITEQMIATNGTRLNVAIAGSGSPIVLLHGFPHTWRLWAGVLPSLADRYLVIAPDLRGLGASERAVGGYDASTIAADIRGLLDGLDLPSAIVVAIDAGAPPAFLLALESPDRVSRLVLIESTIGLLPGAEEFFDGGPPWWFGFHAVPGLAETVIAGHEGDYLDFFYRTGMARGAGIDPSLRDSFVEAYTGTESLRCGFEYYRSLPTNAKQISDATEHRRLTVPTLAIGGQTVGDATAHQLAPFTDDLASRILADSGHIVPLDAPNELLDVLGRWLDARDSASLPCGAGEEPI